MTSTLIVDQFSKLANSHTDSIVPILHETDLRVGPTPPDSYSLDDFESYPSLSPKFHIDAPLYDICMIMNVMNGMIAMMMKRSVYLRRPL